MQLLAFLPVLSALVPHIYARDHKHYDATHLLRIRNIVQETALADSYDFVIAGGGVAGLVLASRLSEDANTTVLVIEAGGTGDDVASSINVPVNCYYDSLLNTAADWAYQTVAQPDAGGRNFACPRGKILGGSSAINGLYLVRPSQIEVDLWSSMIACEPGDSVSAAAWNWDNMFAAMKKTETFTPPSAAIQSEGDIQYNASNHGTTGPLQHSYPGYMYPVVGNWSSTLSAVGVPPSPDAAGGQAWGSYIATSSINPANWTRSYARSAYLDPLPPRANLAVLTGNTVTRLIFSGNSAGGGNLTATQVEYASGASAVRKTVNVGKEVILAGGAVGSPQILMLSGVGPQGVLTFAGVNASLVLPGVGHHLQDHLATGVAWSTSGATDASTYKSQYNATPSTSSPFLSFVNSATAYVNVSTLLGADAVAAFQSNITSFLPTALSTGLVPSTDPTVIAGYEAIYNATANTILT
ncbi:GMC oxidoreductase, partial [Athelia psychrophila]